MTDPMKPKPGEDVDAFLARRDKESKLEAETAMTHAQDLISADNERKVALLRKTNPEMFIPIPDKK